MAKKQSPFEDFMDIAQTLPWWLGLLLAVAVYFGFHHLTNLVVPTTGEIDDINKILYPSIIKFMSMTLQYLVPIGLIGGSLISARRQYLNRKFFDSVTATNAGQSASATIVA